MVFVNHGGEGFIPFHRDSGGPQRGRFDQDDHGMHVRVDDDNVHLKRQFADYLKTGNDLNLAAYQDWTEQSWKTPHGDYASVERFGAKLVEEFGELKVALAARDIKEIESEIGDVIWVNFALASNGEADLDSVIKPLLYEHLMGTYYWDNPDPEWKPIASELSTKQDRLTFADLDRLIAFGFEPVASPAMNRFDDGEELEDLEDILRLIDMSCRLVIAYSHRQRLYGEQPVYFGSEFDRVAREQLGPAAALNLLQLGYLAQCYGLSLESCVKKNITKINGRVEANLVDKSDGARPPELL